MSPKTWDYLVKICNMNEPKFGEWQKGLPPTGKNCLIFYGRSEEEEGPFQVMTNSVGCTHWMPLPPPPKEDWEEAWNKIGETRGMCRSAKEWHKLGFKLGFEAGIKNDRRNI